MAAGQVDLPKLARSYRALVIWVGIQIVVGVLGMALIAALGPTTPAALIVALLRLAILLVTAVALVIYAYKTAAALGSSVPLVWSVAMFFPLINLITLLVLSSKSTRVCKERGVEVGLLGPKSIPDSNVDERAFD